MIVLISAGVVDEVTDVIALKTSKKITRHRFYITYTIQPTVEGRYSNLFDVQDNKTVNQLKLTISATLQQNRVARVPERS